MIKGIIFDLGHTLIQFEGDGKTMIQTGAEAMSQWYFKIKRIKHDQDALVEAFLNERTAGWASAEQTDVEIPTQDCLREALKKVNMPAKATLLIPDAVRIYYQVYEDAWQCYPDTIPTLKMLKTQGYKLGLYSNATDDALVQRLINRNRLRPYLSPTFSSAGYGWRKPHHEIFDLIAHRWELPASEIVMVGDRLHTDVLGAQNAGMASILMPMSEADPSRDNRHIKPTATIPGLATLPGIISQL